MMEKCDLGLLLLLLLQMREEKRKEMNNSKEMEKKGKEINYPVYVWKQGENSEGKKKRKECISFSFVWFVIRKEIKGKYMFFFLFLFFYAHTNVKDA